MTEMTRLRRVGQLIFLLGLLGWGFATSYMKSDAEKQAVALFVAGAVVMAIGGYIVYRETEPNVE
ncbi:MAG: hypothetical protein ABEI57_05040 [Halapricum sp.]